MNTPAMLVDSAAVRESLRGIVARLTADPVLQEDLQQEALIHLWRLEQEHPRQKLSWYLQGCRFHLLHCLARGRSVDAPKRRRDAAAGHGSDDPIAGTEQLPADESMLAWISVHDFIQALSCRIRPFERVILRYLTDGFGVREIAGAFHISHQAVSQHRRRIAVLARRLGLSPSGNEAKERRARPLKDQGLRREPAVAVMNRQLFVEVDASG